MGKSIVTDTKIKAMANTIRTKKTISGSMTLDEIPNHIMDLTYTGDATAQSSHILEWHTAFVKGEKVSGTVQEYDNTYIRDGQTLQSKSVDVATPGITVNTTTGVITATSIQAEGEVPTKTTSISTTLSTYSGQTITPSTMNLTLYKQHYLTGDIVIKGDTNLKAENIKNNVTIFGIKGTGASGGTAYADDVAKWKTFYARGTKITGTAEVGVRTGTDTYDSTYEGWVYYFDKYAIFKIHTNNSYSTNTLDLTYRGTTVNLTHPGSNTSYNLNTTTIMIFDNIILISPMIGFSSSTGHYGAPDEWDIRIASGTAYENNYCTIALPKAVVEYELN